MATFMDKYFSKFQCGFKKGITMSHSIDQNMENSGKSFAALLTDLSKAFDCLPHELLRAELNAYGFSFSALRLICSYLFKRQQRTKNDVSYSSWEEILFEVPQGSILGSLLCNLFDLFIIFIISVYHV